MVQVQVGRKGHKGPLDREAKQARRGHQDPKAQLGPMVPMAQQAPKDLQVKKDRLATTDRPAQKGIEKKKAIRVIRVKKAIRVRRVKKETKVIQDPEAWKAHVAHVRQGLRGPQVLHGPQDPTGAGGDPTLLATKLDKNADINMQGKYEILGLKSNPYPVQGDLDKAISYANQREIFLSKRNEESGKCDKCE